VGLFRSVTFLRILWVGIRYGVFPEMSNRTSNKRVKAMISKASGGVWVNDGSSRNDPPSLWFFMGFGTYLDTTKPDINRFNEFHRTISLTAERMEKGK